MEPAYPELYAAVGGSVPDLRGLFLRGVGGNAAGLGSTLDGPGMGSMSNLGSGIIRMDLSKVVPTANENRPVNKSVRYLIRARP